MESPSAAAPTSDGTAEPPPLTPREQFIHDVAAPQRNDVNQWKPGKSHTRLLLDAARHLKITPKRIGTPRNRTYSLTYSGAAAHGISGAMTTLVSHQAQRATSNRELTRQCLTMSGIDHLPSKAFHITQGSAAAAYADSLGGPVTLTPTAAELRGAARSNISLVGDLAQAWDELALACQSLPVPHQLIDVETFYPWISLRAFAVGENTVAAVVRVPLFVVGDGTSSLGDLADQELTRRSDCRFLDAPQVGTVEQLLSREGLDPTQVLEPGALRLLTDTAEGQLGLGWSVDVTDQLCADLKTLAANTLWAFPGLGASAVDILTPSLDSADQALVARLDPGADIREFRFPAYGKPRLPNRAIMEKIVAQSVHRS